MNDLLAGLGCAGIMGGCLLAIWPTTVGLTFPLLCLGLVLIAAGCSRGDD